MAEDISKVTPSLKCSVSDTKITGSHDVEFRVSVHIAEHQSPTFIELIRQGLIELKDINFVENEKTVPNSCRSCRGDVLSKQKELGLTISVTAPESMCKKCCDLNSDILTPSRRSQRVKRKPTRIAESEINSPQPSPKDDTESVENILDTNLSQSQSNDASEIMSNESVKSEKIFIQTRSKRVEKKSAELNSAQMMSKVVPGKVNNGTETKRDLSPNCSKDVLKGAEFEGNLPETQSKDVSNSADSKNLPQTEFKNVHETVEDSDDEPVAPDSDPDWTSEVNTPATKYIYDSSSTQTPEVERSDESTLNVRRSSRRSKSRFRRNQTGNEEESDSPFVYFDIKIKPEKKAVKSLLETQDQNQDKEMKSPMNKNKMKESTKRRKTEEKKKPEVDEDVEDKRKKTSVKKDKIEQPKKKRKIDENKKTGVECDDEVEEDEDLTLHLSDSDKEVDESDKEEAEYLDDEDADPDFIIAENVEDEDGIDHDELLQEYLCKLNTADNTKEEVYNADNDGIIKVKTEKVTKQSTVITREVDIVRVTVPEIHKEDFPCHICPKSYIIKRYLNRHLNKAGSEPVLCDICDAKFHYQKEVDQHKLVHTGQHQFLCEVCNKCFPTLAQAHKHVNNHLPPHEKPNICPDCGKGFAKEHALREHSLIHAKVKPYQCDKCDAKFAARYLLHAHLKYHSTRIYTCYTCNRVYKVFASLKEHLLIYKDHYTTDEPEPIQKVPTDPSDPPRKRGRKPKNLGDFKIDALKKFEAKIDEQVSMNEEQEEKVGSTKRLSVLFQKDCLDLVATDNKANGGDREQEEYEDGETNVKLEDGSENGDEGESSLKKKSVSKRKIMYSCKICFRRYITTNALLKHYGKSGRVCFPCNKCEAKFHSKRDRKQHQLLHSGEHKYQCKVCYKSFAMLSKCRMHTATHLPTNRKPYSCDVPVCGKTYAFPSHLEKHKRIHNKDDLIKCSMCSLTFTSKSAHGRHMDVHLGVVYKCDTCGKEYKYPSSLKDHLKTFKHISHDQRIVASNLKKDSIEPTQLMCDICGQCYKSLNALNAHQKHHKEPTNKTPLVDNTLLKQFALKKHKERVESHKAKGKCHPNNVGQFKCKECGQEFKLKQSLYRHHSIKHGPCKHQCQVCQKKFFTPSELTRHMLTHNGERSFQCKHCPRAFFHEFGLKRHLKIHVKKESLAHGCNVCGKKFIEACYLRDHMRRHTGEKPFKCDTCGKAYITKNLLKQHMVTHGPLNYFCELCGKGFARVSNFNAHMRKHENNKFGYTYLCDDCGHSFTSQSGLKKHKFKHLGIRNFKCEHPGCIKTFFFKQQLKNHQKSHEDFTPYQCDTCGKSFKYNTSFYNHLRSHREVPPMSCQICGKEFLTAYRLNRHMEHHLGNRTLKCDQCEKCFITQADLNYHKKQHGTTYECKECQKTFKLETRLRTHMKVHLGPERVKCPRCDVFYKDVLYLQTTHFKFCDTKKVCPFCGRKFLNIRKLQSHIGVHTGKRPHECVECGSAFTALEFLEKHQERHRSKRYPCNLCEKGFNRFSDLLKHEELHRKKEHERKKVEEYKNRLQQEDALTREQAQVTATSNNLVQAVNELLVTQAGEQSGQDILALAAASIIQSENMKAEGRAVVQYVHEDGQLEQDYSHVVELDSSAIIQDHCVPVSSEQVILTTIDTSQLADPEGNEILMVAMIPDQQ